jgi:hypothetical protein
MRLSLIKRTRRTKSQMEDFYRALLEIVEEFYPMTVRQAFYQAEVRRLVEKEETGYDKVQRALLKLRQAARIPYSWIVDNTRWQRKPTTYSSVEEVLEAAAASYRKAVWANLDQRLEVWCEKDALAGVLIPVTSRFDVPLLVARGYTSESFAYEAAMDIDAHWQMGIKTYVYHLGDFDPSGMQAAETLNETLNRHAPEGSFEFEQLAVFPDQIEQLGLPTRPTKKTDTRYRWFSERWPACKDTSCELDAVPPDLLRAIVQDTIEQHLPFGWMENIRLAERQERLIFQHMMKQINGEEDEASKYWARYGMATDPDPNEE